MDPRRLATFLSIYPAQPATALWRAIEVGALARHGLPRGLGLDLGCGDGTVTSTLFRETGARNMVGVDSDHTEVAGAARFPFYKRLHVCAGSQVPEDAGTFDFVLANSVLEHITDLDATIAEVVRLLRAGGRFIFTVPSPAFHANLGGSFMPWVSRATYTSRLDRRLAHLRYLSIDEWTTLCARHGLSIITHCSFVTRKETQRWETVGRFTSGLLHGTSLRTRSPLAIQRFLGLSKLQRSVPLPRPLAAALGRFLALGLPANSDSSARDCLGSCLLIEAARDS